METIEIKSEGNGLTTYVTTQGKEIIPITGMSIIFQPNEEVICNIDILIPVKYKWVNNKWRKYIQTKTITLPVKEFQATLKSNAILNNLLLAKGKHWENSTMPLVDLTEY